MTGSRASHCVLLRIVQPHLRQVLQAISPTSYAALTIISVSVVFPKQSNPKALLESLIGDGNKAYYISRSLSPPDTEIPKSPNDHSLITAAGQQHQLQFEPISTLFQPSWHPATSTARMIAVNFTPWQKLKILSSISIASLFRLN